MASEAIVHGAMDREPPDDAAIHMPVLLLTSQALLALSDGGTRLALRIPLAGPALAL